MDGLLSRSLLSWILTLLMGVVCVDLENMIYHWHVLNSDSEVCGPTYPELRTQLIFRKSIPTWPACPVLFSWFSIYWPIDLLLERYGFTKKFTWDIKADTMGKRTSSSQLQIVANSSRGEECRSPIRPLSRNREKGLGIGIYGCSTRYLRRGFQRCWSYERRYQARQGTCKSSLNDM